MGCASQSIKHADSSREFLPSSASKFTPGAFQPYRPGFPLLSDHFKKTTCCDRGCLFFLFSSPLFPPTSFLFTSHHSRHLPRARRTGIVVMCLMWLSTSGSRQTVDRMSYVWCGVFVSPARRSVRGGQQTADGYTRADEPTLTGVFTGVA